ncbi:MAG TPA: hypothetical protein VFT91_07455 [Dehalococcoidia bacterium]|nr:hypothetical protein [Dehalococcoidia bacterium]
MDRLRINSSNSMGFLLRVGTGSIRYTAPGMSMQTGVSYFSARTLRHVRADLQDIVDHGCTYVVHCYTETDLAYYRETMREVTQATHEAGLEVWFDPWGLGGIFSGETFTRFPLEHPETWQVLSDGRRAPAACPNHPDTRAFLRGWVEACAAAGGDVLFWDEPHFYVTLWRGDLSGAWACRCDACRALYRDRSGGEMPAEFTPAVRAFREASLLDLLAELCRLGHEKGLRNALCLIPTDLAARGFPQQEERLRRALESRLADAPPGSLEAMLHIGVGDFESAAALPDLDIFGCDPYWYLFGAEPEPFMRAYSRAAAEAARRHSRGLQLWVQAFSVPAGREEELRQGLRVAQEVDASHVAAWSYEATASMSQIRCANPDLVWRILGEEFRRLKGE